MYIDEKTLRLEIKEVHTQIHELASDLSGDIRYLHQEIGELADALKALSEDLQQLKSDLKN